HDELGGRPLSAIAGMLPRPTSYLLPSPGAVFYQPLTRLAANLPMAWEHTMFAGLAPLAALVFLALALWRRRPLPVSGGAAAAVLGLWGFTFVATLRVGSWHGVPLDLWCLLNAVPGLDSLRAVTRVGLVQLLAGGLAVGIGVTALRARPGLALALALLPTVENWSRCPAGVTAAEVGARAAHVERAIGPGCRAFFWRGDDPAAPPYAVQLDAMWASFDLGIPTLNGYSGNEPPGWPLSDPRAVTPEMARAWLERAGLPADGFCFVP
ncbi:MAG TPA: hypothetical protein VMB50_16650, partial [Myxococcales bacterium]|nr:hypothetical protein [Myxococcales bacterium]